MASDVVGGQWVEPIARRRDLGTHGGERGTIRRESERRWKEEERCVLCIKREREKDDNKSGCEKELESKVWERKRGNREEEVEERRSTGVTRWSLRGEREGG